MLSVLVTVVTLAGPPRVAAPGFIRDNVTPAIETWVNTQLATDFAEQGVEVMTAAQVQSALAAQNLADLAGCEEGSCVGDVGRVLQVDALLLGSLSRVGTAVQLDARLVSTADASIIATFSKRAPSEATLLEVLDESARAMAPLLGRRLGRTLAPLPPAGVTQPGAVVTPPARSVRYERVNAPARNVGKWTLIGGAVLTGVSLVALPFTLDNDAALTVVGVGFLAGVVVMGVGLIIYLAGGTTLREVKTALFPGSDLGGFTVAAPWWW